MNLLKTLLLVIAIASTPTLRTKAQRTQLSNEISLLSNECLEYLSHYDKITYNERKEIIVSREPFTTLASFTFVSLGSGNRTGRPVLMVCPIDDSQNPETLNLIVGLQDYSTDFKSEVTVNVYLNGKKTAFHKLSSDGIGESKNFLLDVSNVKDVAIEAICSFNDHHIRDCPSLHITKASVITNSLAYPK